MTLSPLIDQILAFRDERDWAQFHTPKHLANALGIEVAEQLSIYPYIYIYIPLKEI